jgi:hypothetical protein
VPETVTRSRRGRLLRFTAALAVLLALASYIGAQYLNGGGGTHSTRCVVRASTPKGTDEGGTSDRETDNSDGDGNSFRLTPEQAANAATISAVGITKGMPERAITIALATALQESALRNLKHGDRDSLGLFQQRPSAGWGTEQQILDPVHASGQFYDRLAEVPGYSRLPLTVAAQDVQHSGYPQAYAKHEPDATLLAAAFTGLAPAVLTCPAPVAGAPGSPDKVRAALVRAFGPDVLPSDGSAASGTADAGTAAAQEAAMDTGGGGSAAHADQAKAKRAAVLSVPVRAVSGMDGGEYGETAVTGAAQRGWELAHWAVAQSSALRIDRVSYDGREWTADHAAGWQTVRASGSGTESNASQVDIGIEL